MSKGLTGCISEFERGGAVFNAEDKTALMVRAGELFSAGKSTEEAARTAVTEQLASLRAMLGETKGEPQERAPKAGGNIDGSKTALPREFVGVKMGDFYEIIGENAREAAKILDLTLTRSRKGDEPMVGWPYHSHDRNVAALAKAGIKFVDQTKPTGDIQFSQAPSSRAQFDRAKAIAKLPASIRDSGDFGPERTDLSGNVRARTALWDKAQAFAEEGGFPAYSVGVDDIGNLVVGQTLTKDQYEALKGFADAQDVGIYVLERAAISSADNIRSMAESGYKTTPGLALAAGMGRRSTTNYAIGRATYAYKPRGISEYMFAQSPTTDTPSPVASANTADNVRSAMVSEFGADTVTALEKAGLLFIANAPPPSMPRNVAGSTQRGEIGLYARNMVPGSVAVAYHEALHATLRKTIGDDAYIALEKRFERLLVSAGGGAVRKRMAQGVNADAELSGDALRVLAGIDQALDQIEVVLGAPVRGGVDAGLSAGTADVAGALAKALADLPKIESGRTQRSDLAKIKRVGVVLRMMRAVAENPKVFNAVVELVPVDVVNMLVRGERAADAGLNDGAVLVNRNAVAVNDPVAASIDAATVFARRAAEAARLVVADVANESRAALGADGEKSSSHPWVVRALETVPNTTASSGILQEVMAYAVEQYQANREAMPAMLRKWAGDFMAAIKAGLVRALQSAGVGVRLRAILLADPAVLHKLARDGLRNYAYGAAKMALRTKAQGDTAAQFAQAPKTDSEAFRKWFGESVVTDNGKPISEGGKALVVYHGTTADFDAFKPGTGWFEADPGAANFWGGMNTEGARVVPAFLSIKKPLFMPADEVSTSKVLDALTRNAIDGVIVREGGKIRWAIVQDPEQIKSATGNRGTFDPTNPDIRFSEQSTPAGFRSAIDNAVHAQFDGTISNWDKSVGTPYNLAQRRPQFKVVFDALNTFLKDVSLYAHEAADKAPRLLPSLNRIRDIAKSPVAAKDSTAIAKPIFEGTLVWTRSPGGKPMKMADRQSAADKLSVFNKAQDMLRDGVISPSVLRMWQGLPLDQYERNVNSRYGREVVGQAGVVWKDAELASMFGLDKKQISLYREFRAATDKSLDDMTISAMLRVGGKHTADLTEQAMGMKLDDAAELLRDRMFDRASQEKGKTADELNATGNQMIDLADKASSLKDHGYAPLMRFGDRTISVYEGDELVYFGMYENGMERMRAAAKLREAFPGAKLKMGTVSKLEFKLFAGVTPETLELFGDVLGDKIGFDTTNPVYQEFIRKATASQSGIKRLLHRKGTAGYNEDPARVLASFVYSNARQTSGNLHAKTIADSIEAIDKQSGELKDYAVTLDDYVRNPQEEAQQIRALMFVNFIGGSIASAMTNLTQPMQVTLPYLMKHDAKAPAHMASALSVMWKKSTGDAALDAALQHAEPVLSPQEVHHLLAQARGSAQLRSGQGVGVIGATANNAMARLMVLWSGPFSLAEQFNRRLTFIAAYKTAQSKGMPSPAGFAEQAVDETQYVYSKVNAPRFARGQIGAPLMTFKRYSISWVEGMVRLARSGPEGKAAALLMLAMLVLAAGAEGLPFREDLEDMIDGFAQRVLEKDFSTKDWRRKLLREVLSDAWADFVERGVSGMPGVPIDVAGRMGLHNLIPGTGLLLKKKDHGRDVAEVGGAAGSLLKQYGEAAALAAEGDMKAAAIKASPMAAQNVAKAADMLKTGTYRDARGNVVKTTTPGEAVGKGAGYQPRSVAERQDATGMQQRRIAYVRQIESEIVDDIASAVFLNDAKAETKAYARLDQWNKSNPDSEIKITQTQVRGRVKNMGTEKEDRVIKSAPKEIRGSVEQGLRP